MGWVDSVLVGVLEVDVFIGCVDRVSQRIG